MKNLSPEQIEVNAGCFSPEDMGNQVGTMIRTILSETDVEVAASPVSVEYFRLAMAALDQARSYFELARLTETRTLAEERINAGMVRR